MSVIGAWYRQFKTSTSTSILTKYRHRYRYWYRYRCIPSPCQLVCQFLRTSLRNQRTEWSNLLLVTLNPFTAKTYEAYKSHHVSNCLRFRSCNQSLDVIRCYSLLSLRNKSTKISYLGFSQL